MILLCFIALIYGLYIKIGKKQSKLEVEKIYYKLNVEEGHEITDIDLINNDKILFTIKNKTKTYAIIYDIDTKKMINIEQENE